MDKHDNHQQQGHEHPRPHGRDAGSQQTQLGHAAHAIDEQPVEEDVEHIAHHHDPHSHAGPGNAVEELLERVEHTHKEHAYQVDQEVGPYERQEFVGLPYVV